MAAVATLQPPGFSTRSSHASSSSNRSCNNVFKRIDNMQGNPSSRPSSKARRLDSGFVVTSRPLPPSQSGTNNDWIAIETILRQPQTSNKRTGIPFERSDTGSSSGMPPRSPSVPPPLSPTSLAKRRMQMQRSASVDAAGFNSMFVDDEVKDTTRIKLAYDAKGRRMVNQYIRLREIGRGTHGRVWLCEEVDPDTGVPLGLCAMKEVYREEPQRNLKKAQTARHGDLPKNLFIAPFQATATESSNPATPTAHTAPLSWQVTQDGNFLSPRSHETPNPLDDPAILHRPEVAGHQATPEIRQYDGSDLSSVAESSGITPTANIPREENLGPVAGLYMSRQRTKRTPLQMDEKVRQEIAIMKRCHHKHVVKLKEVINDPQSKKIFMVLEYMAGGQIEWQAGPHNEVPTMTVDQARQTFRDVLLGLEYLHHQGIIHRDIKPANLLWTDESHSCVKISDFGVSHLSESLARSAEGESPSTSSLTDRALRKTAGSPAFFAPELCYSSEFSPVVTPFTIPLASGSSTASDRDFESSFFSHPSSGRVRTSSTKTVTTISKPLSDAQAYPPRSSSLPPVGKAIDVWALGVTLYCLLFGTTPFRAETEYMLYNIIPREEAPIPEYMGIDSLPSESEEGTEIIDLLSRLLEKDPVKRLTLAETKKHPWVLRKLQNPEEWLESTNPAHVEKLTVTTEDVQRATADRFVSASRGGLRSSLKRAMTKFGQAMGVRSSRSHSVSSNSAVSTMADNLSEGSASQPPSRKISSIPVTRKSTPPHLTPANTEIGRKWSVKHRFGGAQTPSSKVSTPNTNENGTPILSRSLSGSSAGTSISALDRNNLLKLASEPATSSARYPQATMDFDDLPVARQKSTSSFGGERYSLHGSDADNKLSLRYVWDKLKGSGTRTPNSVSSSRRNRPPHSLSCTEEDTDADSSQPGYQTHQSLSAGSAEDLPIVESERADYDAFGRKIMRVDNKDLDEDDDDNESRQLDEDDFDDDGSLSELDGDDEMRQSSSGLAWNEGSGWHYQHQQSPEQQEVSSPHEMDPSPEASEESRMSGRDSSAEHLTTPKAALKLSLTHIHSNRPSSISPPVSHQDSALYSGDDADVEHEDDEEAEIELDVKPRRRRGTHELLSPVDFSSHQASPI